MSGWKGVVTICLMYTISMFYIRTYTDIHGYPTLPCGLEYQYNSSKKKIIIKKYE